MTSLSRREMDSPIGTLTVVADGDAIVAIWFEAEVADSPAALDRTVEAGAGEHAILDRAIEQLEEYFRGERTEFELPLAPQGTPFQQKAWLALREIPFGETITYGEQARRLGDPNKSPRRRCCERQEPDPDRRTVPQGCGRQRTPDRLRRRPRNEGLVARPRVESPAGHTLSG